MSRVVILLIFLCWAGRASWAAESETELFEQASKAFSDGFYPRAEQQFAEFVTRFPGATNVAQAILLQGEARFFQKRYEAALEILRQNAERAGAHAAEFTFWIAECLRELGNHSGAAQEYRAALDRFPVSAVALKASYLEAYCWFQLKEFGRAAELLQNPEGHFQRLSKAAPGDPAAIRGHLLLADSLIALGKGEEARAELAALQPPADLPELAWEKSHLLARLDFAGTTPEAALGHLSNAVAAAQSAKRPLLEAQSRNLEADVYRKMNRSADAIGAYEKIGAIESLPVDQKRLAVLKTVEMLATTGARTNAIIRLERYLAGQTNEPAADLLHLKAGELWLDEFRQRAGSTNALQQARAHLNAVLASTNSPHVGRAWLSLGWCEWEEATAFQRNARLEASETAFRNAAEKLTRSDDQAIAVFKIADVQFAQGRADLAVSNYLAVARNYMDLPQVKNALLDKTYRQLIRASIELKNFADARHYLSEFRSTFPNNVLVEETFYLYGRALAEAGQSAEARAVFLDFLQNYPGSPLAPEVRFAEARTYAAEGSLEVAVRKHDDWLRTHTNSALRAQVEFRRATLLDQAGQRTNALSAFTNYVAQYATSPLAPAAQSWVADYHYEQEQWLLAEQNYQRLFQNTNWLNHPLAYEARLMAAKTAFKRQGYNDARSYLTNLINTLAADPKSLPHVAAEAYFVLGDVFLEEPITGSTNNLHNFLEAAKVFDLVATQYPSTRLAVLALGKKGDCHLQLASAPGYLESYGVATNAYLSVLSSTVAGIPISVRNQAEVGLAIALKNMAETRPAAEKQQLLRAALDRFLNVVYGGEKGAAPDPYYLKLAGLEAGRLAETLGDSAAALQLYKRLAREAPALKHLWEARMSALQQRLTAAATR